MAYKECVSAPPSHLYRLLPLCAGLESRTRQILQFEALRFLTDTRSNGHHAPLDGRNSPASDYGPCSGRVSPLDGHLAPSDGHASPWEDGEDKVIGGPSNVSTTGKRFTQSLSRLLTQLQGTTAHFVHCVKPNADEAAARLIPEASR